MISVPSLLLSFAVWMVWSVVVAKLPSIGFTYTTDQLFWLAALPGLSGATLRIFYSFMVPIFGGRLWTTLTTWSLIVPAVGIGMAVQNPATPYWLFLALALLCGFGGGNFASSMSNISFFFPKAEKGNALALNAGLGNLGVSVVQFAVPLIVTAGVFGWLGGDPVMVKEGGREVPLWLQNAGFIWVPFIAASAFAAWFGMNDIASAKASFAEQSVIFQRKHNWIMCWLYTGTFGSFIGYSAAMPLLIRLNFWVPEPAPLGTGIYFAFYAFLGAGVGSITRPFGGWLADRWGGARVTLASFVAMVVFTLGVLWAVNQLTPNPGADPAVASANAAWFPLFLGFFLCIFAATGVGNGSVYKMIPALWKASAERETAPGTPERGAALTSATRQSSSALGVIGAVGAVGGFLVPLAFAAPWVGDPLTATRAAFTVFTAYYVGCAVLTWALYLRRPVRAHGLAAAEI
jgi:NNP family nitrate/nitrite transporter-like MFS transporter